MLDETMSGTDVTSISFHFQAAKTKIDFEES